MEKDEVTPPKKEHTLISGISVTLDKLNNPEDAEDIIRAVSMIKGVLEVKLVKSSRTDENYARRRTLYELKKLIQKTLDDWERL